MVYSAPIPIGTDPWGAQVNDTFSDLHQQVDDNARDHNAVFQTFDAAANSGSSTFTTGTPFMSRVPIREPATLTGIGISITTAGVALTAGQNFVGLYNAAGSRVAVSADCTATFGLTGYQEIAFTAPFVVTQPNVGYYFLALLANGTTSPSLARGAVAGSGASTINYRLTAATGRFAQGPAAQTSLPASITMASRTLSAISMWNVVF